MNSIQTPVNHSTSDASQGLHPLSALIDTPHSPELRDSSRSSDSPGPVDELQETAWLEIFSSFACWVGIIGLILIITQSAWALDARTPFPSHPAAVHPNMGNPSAGGAPNRNFYEDDDFDDDDDDFDAVLPPGYPGGNPSALHKNMPPGVGNPSGGNHPLYGHPGGAPGGNISNPYNPSSNFPGSNGPRSFSAGGTGSGNTGPDPFMTDKGISVSGGNANGVISKGKVPTVKVDDETAEGSKDVITDFNFPDADILDIAKTLGKLTGKNFILDKDVKGRITIISNSSITVGEAWKVFLTALDINGFAIIPSGKYLRIARQRDARDKQLKTYTGDYSPDTDALISRVFPLKYISSEEVARTFRGFMPANSRILAYDQTNTVIVTDTGSNIAKLAKMLEILDVEGFEAGIEVVPVKFASAAELSKLIDALIPGTAAPGPGGGGPGVPRFGGGTGSRFSARRTKEGGIINTIISDDRTNTLIVHANTKGADQVRELVAKLDQRVPATQGGKVQVYYLQFADAEQVANTLNNFSQGTSKTGGPSTPGGTGSGTGVNPISQSLFEGLIKISPDKSTNALVITASPSDYVTVKRVINKLDIPRDQVYVEVAIMEVAIGQNFDFAANIASPSNYSGSLTSGSDLASIFTGNFASLQGGLIGIPLGGGSSSININGTQQTLPFSAFGLVKALQGNSNANILATPQIIALDNTEATFENTQKLPVLTNTITANGFSQQTPTKEPVTLSIKIKPQINKLTNFVKLDVTSKLSNVDNTQVPAQLQNATFGTNERTAQTTVVVGDSDTVVLGGLMRENVTTSETKVPLLGDIPILGWLFKAKKTASSKTNMLIFMTPHIIKQYEKMRAILDKKLKERDDFIENSIGGNDNLREHRDNIIRSLPNIKDLVQKQIKRDYADDDSRATGLENEHMNRPMTGSGPGVSPGITGEDKPFNPEGRAPTDPVQKPNPVSPAVPVLPTLPPQKGAALQTPNTSSESGSKGI